jgi:hypothetical protein
VLGKRATGPGGGEGKGKLKGGDCLMYLSLSRTRHQESVTAYWLRRTSQGLFFTEIILPNYD